MPLLNLEHACTLGQQIDGETTPQVSLRCNGGTCSVEEALGSHVSPLAPDQVPSSDKHTLPQLYKLGLNLTVPPPVSMFMIFVVYILCTCYSITPVCIIYTHLQSPNGLKYNLT